MSKSCQYCCPTCLLKAPRRGGRRLRFATAPAPAPFRSGRILAQLPDRQYINDIEIELGNAWGEADALEMHKKASCLVTAGYW